MVRKLSESAGLSFGFEQAEDIIDLDCSRGKEDQLVLCSRPNPLIVLVVPSL